MPRVSSAISDPVRLLDP